jgi:hypothetical protein
MIGRMTAITVLRDTGVRRDARIVCSASVRANLTGTDDGPLMHNSGLPDCDK